MEIWSKGFVQWEHSYGDLDESLSPAGTKLQRSGSKSSFRGNKVTEIKVFAWRDIGYGDLDESLRPAGTSILRSGSKSSFSVSKVTAI